MFDNLYTLVIQPISWRGEYNIDSINTNTAECRGRANKGRQLMQIHGKDNSNRVAK